MLHLLLPVAVAIDRGHAIVGELNGRVTITVEAALQGRGSAQQ